MTANPRWPDPWYRGGRGARPRSFAGGVPPEASQSQPGTLIGVGPGLRVLPRMHLLSNLANKGHLSSVVHHPLDELDDDSVGVRDLEEPLSPWLSLDRRRNLDALPL
jgi:hypothetical protein